MTRGDDRKRTPEIERGKPPATRPDIDRRRDMRIPPTQRVRSCTPGAVIVTRRPPCGPRVHVQVQIPPHRSARREHRLRLDRVARPTSPTRKQPIASRSSQPENRRVEFTLESDLRQTMPDHEAECKAHRQASRRSTPASSPRNSRDIHPCQKKPPPLSQTPAGEQEQAQAQARPIPPFFLLPSAFCLLPFFVSTCV